MKSWFYHLSCGLLAILLLKNSVANAQKVGSEAFLQGDYIEVGIATNGSFGTDNPPPSGYHARGVGSPPLLGFVADPDKDGWAVGSPNYIGDYFLPGSPQEGWDMELNGVWARAWRGGGGTTFTGGLTGAVTTYNTTTTSVEGIWEGTLGDLKIVASTVVKKDKLYFTTKVKIINTGSTTLYNFYYNRTVDPDNEVATPPPASGSYVTTNKIVYALPSPNNKTLVTAIGTSSVAAYLGLASRDCRALPYIMISGLTPTDSLNKIYSGNGTTNVIRKVDSTYQNDVGIGIVFKIDSLEAGDSTLLSYAYVLSEADVDSAFEDLKPALNVDGLAYISGDTLTACNGSILDIDIVGGDFYEWHWSPTTGLSDSVGSRLKVTVGTTPMTYTATAISDLCPIPPVTITIIPIINPDKPKVVSPIYYCQYDAAPPLTATSSGGATLKWYTSATGGTSTASLTPLTNIPGSKTYYVSQVSAGECESDREPLVVITRALPKISTFSSTDPSYCGAFDASITFYVDSVNKTYQLTYDKNGNPVGPITITIGADGKYTLNGLGGGSYANFIVTNEYGCKSTPFIGPVELIDPRPPGPPITHSNPYCVGDSVHFKVPYIDGAIYTWTGPDGFSSSDREPSFEVTETSGGTYTLNVNVGSCIYLPSTTTVEISPTPKHQKFAALYTACEHDKFTLSQIIESATSYTWLGNGLYIIDKGFELPGITESQAGKYYLTATNDAGCTTLDSITIQVDKRATLILPNDTAICDNDSAILNVSSNGISILWTPGAGVGDSTSFSTKARPQQSTLYTATVKTGSACPDTTGTVMVSVIPSPEVKGYDTLVRMNIPYTLTPMYGQEVIKWMWQPADSLNCSACPNPVFNSNRPMSYVVTVTNKEGCTSTANVNVSVFCDGANVTMPNAFTPNNDGHNDIFYVRGTGFTVKSFSIYNRLGQLVFSKENFLPNDPQFGWDGTFNGQTISDAAGFVYMIEVICFNSNNAPELIKGTVLMIK